MVKCTDKAPKWSNSASDDLIHNRDKNLSMHGRRGTRNGKKEVRWETKVG